MKRYIVIAALAATMLCGCAKTDSLVTPGKKVTADELRSEAESLARKESDRVASEAERLESEARRRKAEYERAVARLNLETQTQLAELSAKFEADLADSIAARTRLERESASALADIRSKAEAGFADIAQQNAAWTFGVDVVSGVVASSGLPGAVGIAGLIAALGGVLWGATGRKKAEDKGWDEAKADSDRVEAKVNATWEEASNRSNSIDASAIVAALIPLIAGRIQPTTEAAKTDAA